jgi:tRNA 2-selenouridine synthase SelU
MKRIINDLYETEKYKDNASPQPIRKQKQPQTVITEEDFENKLKRIIEKNIEDNNDKQPQQFIK